MNATTTTPKKTNGSHAPTAAAPTGAITCAQLVVELAAMFPEKA